MFAQSYIRLSLKIILPILLYTSYTHAQQKCALVLAQSQQENTANPQLIEYGSPYQLKEFPQPHFSVFLLGKGSFGEVYRIIDNVKNESFVIKNYSEERSLNHDVEMLQILSRFNPQENNIRIVKVQRAIGAHNLVLEDVKGTTLGKVIRDKMLSEQHIEKLLQDLYEFEVKIMKGLKKKYIFANQSELFFSNIKTDTSPIGVPTLRASFGYFQHNDLYIKQNNILVDAETANPQLVIIDPN